MADDYQTALRTIGLLLEYIGGELAIPDSYLTNYSFKDRILVVEHDDDTKITTFRIQYG